MAREGMGHPHYPSSQRGVVLWGAEDGDTLQPFTRELNGLGLHVIGDS
jgi:hypothetical protein